MNYLTLLKSNIDEWNSYREQHPDDPCNLAGQDLSKGYFFAGNFRGLNLQGVSLRRACLIGADFTGADLSGADLREAYLADAILSEANLSCADFTGAHIDRVDLRQANLEGAQLVVNPDGSSHNTSPPVATIKQPQTARPWNRLRQRRALWIPGIAGLVCAMALFIPSAAINPINSQTESLKPEKISQRQEPQPQADLALAQSFYGSSQVWAIATLTQKGGRSLLIAGEDNGQIEIWDRTTGERLHLLTGHTDTVRTLAVSASGHWLISGGGDGLKVWRIKTG
ncbi:MAG: pentapeptide repeat-containing protein, partial [Cyanobacteria bacterium J06636_28]